MERKIFTIKGIEREAGSIKIFTLSPEGGKSIPFKPGQFAMLYQVENPAADASATGPLKSAGLQGGNFGNLSRPYSIASSPQNSDLRFAIKITGGQFTSILDKMHVGGKLGVAAPFGHFAYGEEEKIICIAAGTGVAPMLGILEYAARKKKTGRFALFYSNKREEWIGCRKILERLQKENPGITVVYTLTQEQPKGWKGELGRINGEMIKKHADYAPEATVFICGPMEFAKAMKEIVLKLDVDEKRIKVEAWG